MPLGDATIRLAESALLIWFAVCAPDTTGDDFNCSMPYDFLPLPLYDQLCIQYMRIPML